MMDEEGAGSGWRVGTVAVCTGGGATGVTTGATTGVGATDATAVAAADASACLFSSA